jgi:hypothetical protein
MRSFSITNAIGFLVGIIFTVLLKIVGDAYINPFVFIYKMINDPKKVKK